MSKRTRAWLRRHPQVTFPDPPTSCSWLSPAAGFFSILPRHRRRDGVFFSRGERVEALLAYVALHNREYPKPYQWHRRNAENLILQHGRRRLVLHTAQAEATG